MIDEELKKLCEEVVNGNPDDIEKYKNGQTGLLGRFVGTVMYKCRGEADLQKVATYVKELLK